MHPPELVAHRGWAHRFPENTLIALEGAFGAGARWVEVDVQISADGFPVLFHDRSLERMCGVSGAIHQRTLSDLRALSCGERGRFGERYASEGIASLAGFVQLLRRHPEARAFVEIKRASIEHFGAARVLERVLPAIDAAQSQISLISFSLPFLHEVRRWHPIPLGAVVDRWEESEAPIVREIDPEYLFCDVEGLPAEGRVAHGRARIAVWEVADPALALALGERGVELVETFEIGEMLEAFRVRHGVP